MTDLLRDPIWQFIGAVLAFIAIAVSVLFYALQRRKKSLAYDVLAETALLTVNEQIGGKLQILFKGTPVQDVHLLVLMIFNNGNIPVASSDFERPLSFSFGQDAAIFSAEITRTTPEAFMPTLNVQPDHIVLQPTLFNSRDSVTIKLLLTRYHGTIVPDARIIGVREVERAKAPVHPYQFLTTFIFIAFALITWSYLWLSKANELTILVSFFSLALFWIMGMILNRIAVRKQ